VLPSVLIPGWCTRSHSPAVHSATLPAPHPRRPTRHALPCPRTAPRRLPRVARRVPVAQPAASRSVGVGSGSISRCMGLFLRYSRHPPSPSA
jgi:hypothetical protein